MAKIKLHTARALVDAGRTSQAQLIPMLKRAGIKPVQEIKTGKMTYRLFDQAAMDYVVAWRAEKDAPKAAPAPASTTVPEAAPQVSDPGAVFAVMRKLDEVVSKIDALNTQHRTDRAEIDNGMRYLNTKLDQLIVQVRAISNDLGIGATVLGEVAKSPADDEVVRN